MGWTYDYEHSQQQLLWTPEDVKSAAQAMRNLRNDDFERPLSQTRVKKLKEIVLAGEHRNFDWAIAHVPSEGIDVEINGQHSTWLFLALTHDEWLRVRFPVVIQMHHFLCDTTQDLPMVFRHWDVNFSPRSVRDNMGSVISVSQDLHGKVDVGLTSILSKGLAKHEREVLRIRGGADQRLTAIVAPRYFPFLSWAKDRLQPKRHPELFLDMVVAAMAHTMIDGDGRATAFWQSVAIGPAASDVDSPEHKLCRFLEAAEHYKSCDWPNPESHGFPRGQRRPTKNDVFATCLRAVSAYLHDRKVGEIFQSAKKRKLPELAQELYPLHQLSAV